MNYCGSSKVKKAAQSVFVLCDSSVAIDMIIQRSGSVNKPDVLELLQSQAKELAKMNVSIYLAWILGHAGIEGNERADKLAKDMSEDIFKGRVSATSCISMNSALIYQQKLHTTPGRGSGSVTVLVSTHVSWYLELEPDYCFLMIVILAFLTVDCCFVIQC